MCDMWISCWQRPEEGVGSTGNIYIYNYIVIYITMGCWDSDPSSLDEQPVFLAVEPALQAHAYALLHEIWGWN